MKVKNFRYCLADTPSILFHPLHYHVMSTKIDMNISDSKKSFMVTIHETVSLSISIKLDGANYHIWSQILEIHIAARKKKGYIIGRKVALVEDDPNYDECEAKDALVKSWLINSMIDWLMSHFM